MDTEEMSMQIYAKISELEAAIDNSPIPRFGGSDRRIIDVDELFDILGDLKVTIPEDIRKANSVLVDAEKISTNAELHASETVEIANERAESIIAEANAKAAALISNAEAKATEIVTKAEESREQILDEHDIAAEARRRADLLLRKAEYNAKTVYENAKEYADGILGSLMSFLEEYYAMVEVNKKDLGVIHEPDFNVKPDNAKENALQNENDEEVETSLFGFLKKKKHVQG